MVALSATASFYNTPKGLHALCFSQGAVRERAGRGGARARLPRKDSSQDAAPAASLPRPVFFWAHEESR